MASSEMKKNVGVRRLTLAYVLKQWKKATFFMTLIAYLWFAFSSVFETSKEGMSGYGRVGQKIFMTTPTRGSWGEFQKSSGGKGCNPFLLEHCISIGYDASILEEPELLTKIADSIVHPCRYLLSPHAPVPTEGPMSNKLERFYDFSAWFSLGCETNEPDRRKINIVLLDKQSEAVLYIVKP